MVAFPVTGPRDVIEQGVTGVMAEDLAEAVRGALELSPARCRDAALGRSWARASQQFLANLAPASTAWDDLERPRFLSAR